MLNLQVYLIDGKINIAATVIECKVAQKSETHLAKASDQVISGIIHLSKLFMPRDDKDQQIYFNRRYWWAQLYRVIVTNEQTQHQNQTDLIFALESLSEGDYNISWSGLFFTFWTDILTDQHTIENKSQRLSSIKKPKNDSNNFIYHVSCPSNFASKALTTNFVLEFPDNYTPLIYEPFINDKDNIYKSSATQKKTNTVIENSPQKDIKIEPNVTAQEHKDERTEIHMPTKIIPDRIYLGKTQNGKEVFWEFGNKNLTNRHILIFGTSGSGKTYTIQTILAELAQKTQNSIIIDYTDGFVPKRFEQGFADITKPLSHFIEDKPLPINPFRQQKRETRVEKPYYTAMRAVSVFDSVFNLGEQQKSVMLKAIERGLEQYSESFNLTSLYEILSNFNDRDNSVNQVASNLANKIYPFERGKPFGKEDPNSWMHFLNNSENKVLILQMSGVPRELARLTTEFILWDIFYYAANYCDPSKPVPIVLDEIQNLDHKLDAPLGKIMTEGRKFGLCAILATQTMSNLKSEEQDRLFQSAHKLFFKPTETEIKEYAKILSRSTNENEDTWITRLSSLHKGECFSLGPSLYDNSTDKLKVSANKILITSFKERTFNK